MASIEELTKTGIGLTGQGRFNTTNFSNQFQNSEGRAATQKEKKEFLDTRTRLRETRTSGTDEPRITKLVNRPILDVPESSFDQAQKSRFQGLEAPSETSIRDQELERARAKIAATEGLFQEELGKIRQEGAARLAETSSIGVGAGLAGSPFKQTIEEKTREGTRQQESLRQKERSAEISDIMNNAESRARLKFKEERQFFKSEEEARLEFLSGTSDRARETLTNLATGGVSLDELSRQDFTKLLSESGLSELEARALHSLNSPEATADYSIEGNKLIGVFVDPTTGKPKITSQIIPGLEGADEANIQEFDGVPYVIGKDAEGKVTGTPLPGFVAQVDDEVVTLGNKDTGFYERDPATGKWEQIIGPAIDPGIAEKSAKEKEREKEKVIQNTATLNILQDKLDDIDSLKTSKGLKGSVGEFGINRFTPFAADKAERKDFSAGVDQLIAQETLDILVELKARGGTLGALSEKELVTLQNAATKINSWEIKDDNGNGTGRYEISEELFVKELDKIAASTKRVMEGLVGDQSSSVDQTFTSSQEEEIQFLIDGGFERDEAIQELDFSQPLSMGANGSIVTTQIGGRDVKVEKNVGVKLASADRAFFEATGKHIVVNEGFRSFERQTELHNKFKSGKGGRAAPPGKSFHQSGKAVDIANWKEAESFLRAVGFKNDLKDDRNHFSIGEFS